MSVQSKWMNFEGDEFEWDANKARINFRDHGVRFQEGIPALRDENAVTTVDDTSDPNEERYVTIGLGAKGNILVVTYTYRGTRIRLISVRKAEPHEREDYGKEV